MIATRFEENIFITITICLNALGHKPDKLIEADVPVAIDVDHIDQVLQLLLGRRPPKRPHHLRFFPIILEVTLFCYNLSKLLRTYWTTAVPEKVNFLFWLIGKCEIIWKTQILDRKSDVYVLLSNFINTIENYSDHLSKKENISLNSWSCAAGSSSATFLMRKTF